MGLPATSQLSGRRILIVEDELLVADEVVKTLQGNGVQIVDMARSVTKALALIESGKAFDAAVIDINLAGEMAYPVADALKERSTPFVFATAYGKATLPDRYRQYPYCSKPMQPPDLIRQLLGALERDTPGPRGPQRPPALVHPVRRDAPIGSQNALLETLAASATARFQARAWKTELTANKVLRSPGDPNTEVYFPIRGAISVARSFESGQTAEALLIGREGVFGLESTVRPDSQDWASVAIPGEAWRIGRGALREFLAEDPVLRNALTNYQADLIDDLKQRAVCGVAHLLPQRFAGWLLRCRARAGSDDLDITQERAGHALGVQRTTVTSIARQFKDAGLVGYSRGRLTIRDWQRLEGVACSCHREADPASRLSAPHVRY